MEKKLFGLISQQWACIIGVCFISSLLYFPSLFNFFSHDDFFHLRISQAHSFSEFLNFFNLLSAPSGFGFYRPLTTQVFYFFDWALFGLNPLPLHIISFLVFFANIFLVFKLAQVIVKNSQVALIAAFLYATSATHFGQLYYLGAFQELGLAFLFFSAILTFISFIKFGKIKHYFYSVALFIGALMSKESAVTIPVILGATYFYFVFTKETKFLFKKFILLFIPFLILIAAYLYLHIFYYGLAKGDSYIWIFSPKVINTLFWYFLWSLNIPEMLVDFIGPWLRPVPNLFRYYGRDIIPILGLFFILLTILIGIIVSCWKNLQSNLWFVLFCGAWFLITLVPVLFLPWHKFTYELTVPLFGIILFMAWLLNRIKKGMFVAIFLGVWLSLSILTNILTYKTHWITQGGKVSYEVFNYFNMNSLVRDNKVMVVFYNVPIDNNLPWKPSEQLKNILSDNNFFEVFYPNIEVVYEGNEQVFGKENILHLKARNFLNYD